MAKHRFVSRLVRSLHAVALERCGRRDEVMAISSFTVDFPASYVSLPGVYMDVSENRGGSPKSSILQ